LSVINFFLPTNLPTDFSVGKRSGKLSA